MRIDDAVRSLLDAYPKIFFACHTRHVRDPKTGEALSTSQASILDHLDEVEAIGLLDLARHMGVTPATMSIAVDRLVRRGYVERGRDVKDARRVRLRITGAGLRLREASSVLDHELVAAMLGTLSADELRRGLEGLALLARGAGQLMRERSEQGTWNRRSRDAERTEEGPSLATEKVAPGAEERPRKTPAAKRRGHAG